VKQTETKPKVVVEVRQAGATAPLDKKSAMDRPHRFTPVYTPSKDPNFKESQEAKAREEALRNRPTTVAPKSAANALQTEEEIDSKKRFDEE
jgi:hypothetical protein